MQQKCVLVGTSMTSICHVALSLLQLQLLAPRHCHLKLRKSCKMWKWPLKIKQLSLSLCYKERGRNDMLRHQSSQKKKKKSVKRAARFRSYSVKGAEKEKSKGEWGKKKTVGSNQTAEEARPGHMARGFLDLLCLERKAHHILLHSIHTHVSNQHWTPAQSLRQLIYLPVLYFMKLGDEGKLGEELNGL